MDAPIVRLNLTAFSGIVEQATWTGYREDGSVVGVATGDVTSLFEDTIGYAVQNGFPFHAVGRTYNSVGLPAFLCLYRTIALPPMIFQSAIFDNVCILSRPIDGGWGMVFDSFEDLTWTMRGQFLYRGDAGAVRYSPSRIVAADQAITMNTGKIKWQAITVQERKNPGSKPVVVEFDLLRSSIFANEIDHGEIDGTNVAEHGIRVLLDLSAPNGHIFALNEISASMAYRTLAATVQVGQGFVNQANLKQNKWKFGAIQPGNEGADGFNTFESTGTLTCGAIGSVTVAPAMFRGIVYNTGADNNRYRVGEFVPPYTQNLSNSGSGNAAL